MPMIVSKTGKPFKLTGRFLRRLVLTVALSGLTYGMSTSAAMALSSTEAGTVVAVLEQLAAETGETVFYDEEAADEWFDMDAESSQHIAGAGFTRQSWKLAFDATMTGFIASIPEREFDQITEDFVTKIGEIAQMTESQKQEAMDALRAEFGKLHEVRNAGVAHISAVGPHMQRLRRVVLQR